MVGALALVGTGVPASAAPAALDQVEVVGEAGQAPTVTITKPVAVKQSTSREITAGTGARLAKGSRITFDYLVVNGRTGEQIESSFGKAPASIILDKQQSLGAIVRGLTGASVGARELIAIAPKEGLAAQLNGQGAKKSDTLLFVLDVKSAATPLSRAEGASVAPVAGLPTVKLAAKGTPTIKIPSGDAPKDLVVQPLITGSGPSITAGQTVSVHYKGVIWRSGKQFDSSWSRGEPIPFVIGSKQVIAGWDEGLVGQTVGSQVLLIIPPDKGYGATGQPSAGIKGTDTLVFVVDILDAY